MSSYWGHSSGEGKDRKHSFRGQSSRRRADRRASLPCPVRTPSADDRERHGLRRVSQLDAMHLNRLHAAAMAPAPVHVKGREEKEVRPHPRARRVASDENSRKSIIIPASGITTIPELTESFERRLRFRNQKVVSLGDADNVCLLCHEDKRTGTVHELPCSHRVHKEAGKKVEQVRPRSCSSAATCERGKSGDETRKSTEQEDYHVPRRQLSLRRQR
ncbi:leukemia NUP98 fusion partner 1 isoform X2 [Clupea harengus]|uniref:Leukemia NUP98 fusion partner 1 isoform X2 n=1 Tax=Clupea harengus TaxID=7950 RepID=A0A8M1KCJ2_CLUHA|nr:leukemia NUP98 fusion partner 1 isoform X2 [Clupea harengus]